MSAPPVLLHRKLNLDALQTVMEFLPHGNLCDCRAVNKAWYTSVVPKLTLRSDATIKNIEDAKNFQLKTLSSFRPLYQVISMTGYEDTSMFPRKTMTMRLGGADDAEKAALRQKQKESDMNAEMFAPLIKMANDGVQHKTSKVIGFRIGRGFTSASGADWARLLAAFNVQFLELESDQILFLILAELAELPADNRLRCCLANVRELVLGSWFCEMNLLAELPKVMPLLQSLTIKNAVGSHYSSSGNFPQRECSMNTTVTFPNLKDLIVFGDGDVDRGIAHMLGTGCAATLQTMHAKLEWQKDEDVLPPMIVLMSKMPNLRAVWLNQESLNDSTLNAFLSIPSLERFLWYCGNQSSITLEKITAKSTNLRKVQLGTHLRPTENGIQNFLNGRFPNLKYFQLNWYASDEQKKRAHQEIWKRIRVEPSGCRVEPRDVPENGFIREPPVVNWG